LSHDPLDPYYLLATAVYTLFGVGVFGVAFWLMARVAPFSIRKEIEEDQNVALGVVMGSVIIGLALIIASTVGS
jgi:uncharacterized membrane protein YjfL (UPF0719 family)